MLFRTVADRIITRRSCDTDGVMNVLATSLRPCVREAYLSLEFLDQPDPDVAHI